MMVQHSVSVDGRPRGDTSGVSVDVVDLADGGNARATDGGDARGVQSHAEAVMDDRAGPSDQPHCLASSNQHCA
jgi:hypothetical protein